ncbi:glycosyltransferase family 4 protein [Variovorax sp. ZS18.2.2]|uniref:glycosyltransferase n=1 Tax=Variovorax sp. ZS18.2.2 TaxID=2971255 RepID=UPI002150DB44|nr:glycosyltransferase family 4 protein [Variovorax sp. ZS18.2.2]MCR6476969.1 glycosyltransferase family 4 protein [Variovorax sp. ZS18.2.2]
MNFRAEEKLAAAGKVVSVRLPSANSVVTPQGGQIREAVLHREIAYLLQERATFHAQLSALREEVESSRLQQAHLQTAKSVEVEHLWRELKYREHVISVIYASRSWRIAGMGRGIANLARRILGKKVGVPPVFASQSPSLGAFEVQPIVEVAPPVQTPALERRPKLGRQMLVVSDFLPLYDQQAGGLRLKTLIGLMGEAGWSIVFASVTERAHLPGVLATPEGKKRYEDVLGGIGVNRFLYGLPELDAYLVGMGRDLDWAFLSFPSIVDLVMPMVRTRCPVARIAYDMVDFHGVRMAREATLFGDAGLMEKADRQRDIEVACAKAADVTLAINEDEKQVLLSLAPEAVVDVIPLVFEVPENAPPDLSSREGLLFVGGFWHRPNGDAICWFVERVWPLVRRAEPHAVLRIAGSNPTDEVLALGAQPGVEVLGFVSDIAAELDRHRISIAPLRWGAGAKGKVGQALMHGLPVVATTVGAEGMSLQDGTHILVADDEEAFAACVIQLLRDDALWSRLSANARKHMENSFSTAVIKKLLMEALDG